MNIVDVNRSGLPIEKPHVMFDPLQHNGPALLNNDWPGLELSVKHNYVEQNLLSGQTTFDKIAETDPRHSRRVLAGGFYHLGIGALAASGVAPERPGVAIGIAVVGPTAWLAILAIGDYIQGTNRKLNKLSALSTAIGDRRPLPERYILGESASDSASTPARTPARIPTFVPAPAV